MLGAFFVSKEAKSIDEKKTTDINISRFNLVAEDDPRTTRVGKIIRKLRIDELPQFLNILKGEMSLIGPRPEQPSFVEEYDLVCFFWTPIY